MVYSITREMRNGQTYVGRTEDVPATFLRPGPSAGKGRVCTSMAWVKLDGDDEEHLARVSPGLKNKALAAIGAALEAL